VEQIVSEISGGAYKLGDKLPPEEAIAEAMGVSRTSVREGMGVLRIAGIIETKQGEGSRVKNVKELKARLTDSLQLLYQDKLNPFEVFVARERIEPAVIDLVVENATSEQVACIEDYLNAMRKNVQQNDLDACFYSNLGFHRAVAAATNNAL